MTWQPIDTLPRGKWVLLYLSTGRYTVARRGILWWSVATHDEAGESMLDGEPTHWMEPPEPPPGVTVSEKRGYFAGLFAR